MADERPVRVLIDNRQGRFEFFLLDTFEAGIALVGSEVKSLRIGKGVLGDAHVEVGDDGAWIVNFHISPYTHGNRNNHEPLRRRRLLLNQHELSKLRKGVAEKGQTIIATKLYLRGSRIKLEIALAKGKKLHDKRHAIKDRDARRELREVR
jgi:SsrA-binding protein